MNLFEHTLRTLPIALWTVCASSALATKAAAVSESLPDILRIELLPEDVVLADTRDRVQLLVTGFTPGGERVDLTHAADWSVSDDIARIDSAIASPLAPGKAWIEARVASRSARIPLRVLSTDTRPISFRYEVEPALTKPGCNSGPCHGSPSGKGGFRLSLRGFDAAFDRDTLLHEERGRRTDAFEPDASLILQKPLGRLAHGGGVRLRENDASYGVLREWIRSGCPTEPLDTDSLVDIEVSPRPLDAESSLEFRLPIDTQQLRVEAHFRDGLRRDVTALAVFSSSDESVAEVSPEGLVRGLRRGESTILVRFLDRMQTLAFTFVAEVPGFRWSDPPQVNYIDVAIDDKLRKLSWLPGERSSDAEFLRRVFLDVIGQLPTLDETRAFLGDERPDKRELLIDRLLERPEFASFWASKWADILRLTEKSVSKPGAEKYWRWLRRAFERNTPYDEFARSLLTSVGSTFENPAANYFRAATDSEDAAESTAQVFLGFRLACAKCHNHPFERWTQDNYYGMSAFFHRVKKKAGGRSGEEIVWVERQGAPRQPRSGQTARAWLPFSGERDLVDGVDPRDRFVEWLREPDNPFFARVEVNRIWFHLLGRGIVHPIDDFRDSNPPSNDGLLDRLARDFVNSGYDRKHIIRTILRSRTYQTTSRSVALNEGDTKYFSHHWPRLLAAEQLLDALSQATGVEHDLGRVPSGTRASQVASQGDSAGGGNEFLKAFGQPERQTVCQCERSTETSLAKALQMFNGRVVHDKLRAENGRIRRLARAGRSDDEIITEFYLAALCRPPLAEELEVAGRYLSGVEDRLLGLEDVCWAILNSNEFLFQH